MDGSAKSAGFLHYGASDVTVGNERPADMARTTQHMNRIVTFLTDDQFKKLKAIQKKTGEAASTLIRMAVADYVDKKDKK
jgi:hypothetical protein